MAQRITLSPEDYGGANTFVGAIWAHQIGRAAHLPIQDLKRPTLGQLDPDLQPLGAEGKLQRIEGWAEARALSHALSGLNFSFEDLKVPKGLLARPLQRNELRVANEHNQFFIYNKDTKTLTREIPPHIQLDKVKALISVSDQGGSNRAALHFLAYGPPETKLMIGLQWDVFHRCWNDLKAGMRKAGLWRMVLSLSISYNLPYGPYNSGQWHHRKAQAAKDFFARHGPHDEAFTSYVPWICWEMGEPEPSFPEDMEALWERIQDAPHWTRKGPLVKLMRWLSFFQSAHYYKHDHFALKMVLSHGDLSGLDGSDGDDDMGLPTKTSNDKAAREELAQLKKTKGTWAVASKVITKKHIQQKDILAVVSHAACTHHSEDARELLTPEQICNHTVQGVVGQGWAQELAPCHSNVLINVLLVLPPSNQ